MNYNSKRIDDRSIDELIGLSKGLIADQVINHREAKFLQNWMEANVPCSQDTMVNHIYRRIHEMLIDGLFDDEEQKELIELLQMFTGESNTTEAAANMTSSLPINNPLPEVVFPGSTFCFTGKFAYGPRKICNDVVTERGGKAINNITMKLDYLVCGYFGSTDWIHSPYGRKIEKAIDYREKSGRPFILTEDHWALHAFRM